jgi:hypothetical protein
MVLRRRDLVEEEEEEEEGNNISLLIQGNIKMRVAWPTHFIPVMYAKKILSCPVLASYYD